jgi:hypothetical protein
MIRVKISFRAFPRSLLRNILMRRVVLIDTASACCAEFVCRACANLGGESPLPAVGIGRASLGKGVHREVESERS